ncbi:hypothetical protein G6F56_011830 [Rhizopus delemar]|nr:hypothetical protein G6F56_011830 [Rhizopus delemar]
MSIDNVPQQDQSALSGVFWTCVAIIGLYSISSLFGVIGGITQNRSMINIFRFLYWIMATLILISSFAAWITVLIKRDDIVTGCQQYLLGLNSNSSSYYSPVNLPNGTISLHKEDCVSATKHLLIIGGIAVFLGNFVQIYFASTINAYATRLKSVGTTEHHKLRNMEDYPETTKMADY